MKKIITFTAMLLVFTLGLLATDAFMAAPGVEVYSFLHPFRGAMDIPLDTRAFGPVYTFDKGGGFCGDVSLEARSTGYKGQYGNSNNICVGGSRNMSFSKMQAGDTISITVNVQSPTGLNFVSLSHPQVNRPFELYLVLKAARAEDVRNYKECKNFRVIPIKKSGDPVTLVIDRDEFNNILDTNDKPMKGDSLALWFDLALCLPGDIPETVGEVSRNPYSLADQNDNISINGQKYKLIVGSDYTAALSISMEISGTAAGVPFSYASNITMPMNAKYSNSGKPTWQEQTGKIAVNILPTPACQNLDLFRQQGAYIKIADMSINMPIVTTTEWKDIIFDGLDAYWVDRNDPREFKKAYIFFSSHENPFQETVDGIDTRFILRHSDVTPYSEFNTRTHMLYKLFVYDKRNPSKYFTYDGTMWVPDNTANLDDFTQNPEDTHDPTLNRLLTTEKGNRQLDTSNEWVNLQTGDFEIGLIMNKSQNIMRKGLYRSKVYVHILTQD